MKNKNKIILSVLLLSILGACADFRLLEVEKNQDIVAWENKLKKQYDCTRVFYQINVGDRYDTSYPPVKWHGDIAGVCFFYKGKVLIIKNYGNGNYIVAKRWTPILIGDGKYNAERKYMAHMVLNDASYKEDTIVSLPYMLLKHNGNQTFRSKDDDRDRTWLRSYIKIDPASIEGWSNVEHDIKEMGKQYFIGRPVPASD